MDGWIKLHRKMMSWEHYTHPNTMRIYIHLLLNCNHKSSIFKRQIVKRGLWITTVQNLSKDLNLTISAVRTGIKALIQSKNIIVKSTKKQTLITIINYEFYQCNKNSEYSLTKNEKNISKKSEYSLTRIKKNEEIKGEKLPQVIETIDNITQNKKGLKEMKTNIDVFGRKSYPQAKTAQQKVDHLVDIKEENKDDHLKKLVVDSKGRHNSSHQKAGKTDENTQIEQKHINTVGNDTNEAGYMSEYNNLSFIKAIQAKKALKEKNTEKTQKKTKIANTLTLSKEEERSRKDLCFKVPICSKFEQKTGDNFSEFWEKMGMKKIKKTEAKKSFDRIVQNMNEHEKKEFTKKIIQDTNKRKILKQFGFERLHPSNYLNNGRWTDVYKKYSQVYEKPEKTSRDATSEPETSKNWVNEIDFNNIFKKGE